MRNKAIFLDRDGVIVKDTDHLYKIRDCEFYKGVFSAIKKFPTDYKKIIITNQAGIAKGLYTEKDYKKLMDWISRQLKKHGIKIDKVYFCPHHPDGIVKKYTRICGCRKPKTGMLKQAQKDFNLNPRTSWLIGDSTGDILAGNKFGCKTILVATGYGGKDKRYKVKPTFKAKNLIAAAKIILGMDANELSC